MQRQVLLNSIQMAQATKDKTSKGLISGKRTDVCTEYTRELKLTKARRKLALISLSTEESVKYHDMLCMMDKDALVDFLHFDVKKQNIHEFFKRYNYLTLKINENE